MRVLFGQGTPVLLRIAVSSLPSPDLAFGEVHAVTRTPLLATVVATAIVLCLALWLPLVTLAKTTSFIILVVFALINLSLALIKRRQSRPVGIRVYPAWISLVGFLSAAGFVLFQIYQWAGN